MADTVALWGTGAMNVGACRVGGRFPANVVLAHGPDCVLRGTKTVKNRDGRRGGGRRSGGFAGVGAEKGSSLPNARAYGGANGETVEDWECTDNCPVRLLDEQSAVTASRFFYCTRATTKERRVGLGHGERNTHPTVKPVELMRWLCRLVTPAAGIVLDPFAGSGSTGVAAIHEGFRFVGIEQDATYVGTARKRIRDAERNGEASRQQGERGVRRACHVPAHDTPREGVTMANDPKKPDPPIKPDFSYTLDDAFSHGTHSPLDVPRPQSKFELGRLVVTEGALAAIPKEEIATALARHASGDWGEMPPEDAALNQEQLATGRQRFFQSIYRNSREEPFWIWTEGGVTTVLLPEEH